MRGIVGKKGLTGENMDTPREKNLRLLTQSFTAWVVSTLLVACMGGSGDAGLSSIFGTGLISGTTTNQATDATAEPDSSDAGTADFAPITIGDTVELPVSTSRNDSDEAQYLTVPNLSMDAVSMDFLPGETSSWFMRLPLIHEARAQQVPGYAPGYVDDNEQEPEPAPDAQAAVGEVADFRVPAVTTVELEDPDASPEGEIGSFLFTCEAGAVFDPSSQKTMALDAFELVFSDRESDEVYTTPINADGSCLQKIDNTYIGADLMVSIRPIGEAAVGDFQVGLKLQDRMKVYITTTPTQKQVFKMAGQAGKTIFVAENPLDGTFVIDSMLVAGGQNEQKIFKETVAIKRLEVSGSARSIGYQFADGAIVLNDGLKRMLIAQGNGRFDDFDLTDKYFAYVAIQPIKKQLDKKPEADQKQAVQGPAAKQPLRNKLAEVQKETPLQGFLPKAIPFEPKDSFRMLGKTEQYKLKDFSATQPDTDTGRVLLNEAQSPLLQGKKDADCRTLVKILRAVDQAQLVINLGQCAVGVNVEFTPNGLFYMWSERVDKEGVHRNDLFRWTIATNVVEKVYSSKMNFSLNDFAMNYDGTKAIFVSQEPKSLQQLFVLDIKSGFLSQKTNDSHVAFSQPKFVNFLPFLVAQGIITDSKNVVHHELFGVYTKTATPVALTQTAGGSYDPQPIPKSGFILYNSADEDGVRQIHILDIRAYLDEIDVAPEASPVEESASGEVENEELVVE